MSWNKAADDVCCHHCKTPYAGVCYQHHQCWCHLERRREIEAGRYTIPDPTGNKAVHNATIHPERKATL